MAKRQYQIREFEQSETEALLRLRNLIFGDISRDHWNAMGCTAVVAEHSGRFYGAIPLQFREFRITPRVSIPVVFENAVGVREKFRGQGIGSAMLECAAGFIRDRADALCVYRGGERSKGYRFYRKTHHGDLFYTCNLGLKTDRLPQAFSKAARSVEVYPWSRAAEFAGKLLRLFRTAYGSHGGYWKREKSYYGRVLQSHVHGNDSCRLLLVKKQDQIAGYAIVNPQDGHGYFIYDIAAQNLEIFRKLIAKIAILASEIKRDVAVISNREHPYCGYFLGCGFEAPGSEPYIMARVLRPDRIFGRLAKGSSLLGELALKAATPHRDLVLNDPAGARHSACLYLKESLLSRLLFCQLDLRSALDMNLVRMDAVTPGIERKLCRIFRCAPWASFRMDYV